MKGLVSLHFAYFLTATAIASQTPAGIQTTSNSVPPEECVLTPEDYAVYSAILLDRGKPEDPEERWDNKPDLVILSLTDSREDGKSGMWGFRSASNQHPRDDTVEHFNSRRKTLCELKPQLASTISYHLFSEEERTRIFKKGVGAGWEAFYNKYPRSSGCWDFSPVGYSTNGTEALVYLGHHCGGLCGTGHLVLLAKEKDHWVVRNRVMLWIS